MIKGKFNGYAYASVVFTLIFFIISVYLLFHPNLKLKGRTGDNFPAPVVGLVFFTLTGFLFYVLSKVIYLVTIDSEFINIKGVFKRRLIAPSEIKEIDLFSKEDFHWSAGLITIGTKIELENGEKFIIANPFYWNMSIIKQALANNFEEKIKPFKTKKPRQYTHYGFEDEFERFSGNPYTSVNGLIFLGIIIFIAFMLLSREQLENR